MANYLIILAGGSGSRFSGDVRKQFMLFHGKELWRHLYDTALEVFPKENVVVVGVDLPGGNTRSSSVKIGLGWIKTKGDCEKVIICEAARAFVTKEQLLEICSSTSQSCCFSLPVVDTILYGNSTYLIRSDCRHLVSPQAFDFELLYNAYSNCSLSEVRTDETKLMLDAYGIAPTLLVGGENLYKVTYPKDLAVIELIYSKMK